MFNGKDENILKVLNMELINHIFSFVLQLNILALKVNYHVIWTNSPTIDK